MERSIVKWKRSQLHDRAQLCGEETMAIRSFNTYRKLLSPRIDSGISDKIVSNRLEMDTRRGIVENLDNKGVKLSRSSRVKENSCELL